MKNRHEIIGTAVEQLINERYGLLDRELLAHRLMEEFIRVSYSDASAEEKQLYESVMKFVTADEMSQQLAD